MRSWFIRYREDNAGVVTVDWIAIAGFTVALALSVANLIGPELVSRGGGLTSGVETSTQF